MSEPVKFLAHVTHAGKLEMAPGVKLRLAQHLKDLAGQPVAMTVEKPSKNRSKEANAWLWGVALPQIAEAAGYEQEEIETMHYDILSVRFGTKTTPAGLIVPTKTSRTLTTREFSDYMEWICRFAAQTYGIVIELPDERGLLQEAI